MIPLLKLGLKSIFMLMLAAISTLVFSEPQAVKHYELIEATIASTHQAMLANQLTCEQLVLQYLERIKEYNFTTDTGPPLNAFSVITPDILNQARNIDQQFNETHQLKGPLHCIPIIVKDNIDTTDSPSTSGTLALLGSQPIKDAFLVTKLRQAGALIIGKGGMDELASGMFGFSSRTGRIGNAYDASKNPGGSSSGSAVAVSANFAMAGIGTDNSGSVRIPAAFNGLVGLRPSMGLISLNGIFPRGNMDGTAGPMTRTVKDLAIVLDAIAAVDTNDSNTLHQKRPLSYAQQLSPTDLHGKHFAIINQVAGKRVEKNMPNDVKKSFHTFHQKLRELGATITLVNLNNFESDRQNNMAGEVEEINAYLAAFPSTRRDYTDICTSKRIRLYEHGEKDCLDHIKATAKKNSAVYRSVLSRIQRNRHYVENIMHKNHIDALLIPISINGIASYDGDRVLTWKYPVSTNSGLPAITLPIDYLGEENSMPVGIEIIGHYFDEMSLLNIAYTIEGASRPRIVPKLPQPDSINIIKQASIPEINNFITEIGAKTTHHIKKEINSKTLTSHAFTRIVKSVLQPKISIKEDHPD